MTTDGARATPDPDGVDDSRVLRELVEQMGERAGATTDVDAYRAWRCHVVGVCIGGDQRYYTLCGECLHREGPFADEFDAEQVALHHRWATRGFGFERSS